MKYHQPDLIRIAKRENNKKRNYLVVNPLQGKHVPVSPKKAFQMMDALAEQVRLACPSERLLLVGFAETATAIGARLAVKLNTGYLQTTREQIPGVEYLYFTESHSHATEQKLVKDDLDKELDRFERVVFVEDEVTTGNTILNIVKILEEKYPGKVHYSVASLLNGMDQQALWRYQEHEIQVYYLLKTDHSPFTAMADHFLGDGKYISLEELEKKAEKFYFANQKGRGTAESIFHAEGQECVSDRKGFDLENGQDTANGMQEIFLSGYQNARRFVEGEVYKNACEKLWAQIQEYCLPDQEKSYLVLGTEEFMYPALYIASKLEDAGCQVRCHATTRSPIEVSSEKTYPLHVRYELRSLYEEERKTFVYDLQAYDQALILSDALDTSPKAIDSLAAALELAGTKHIQWFRWCDKTNVSTNIHDMGMPSSYRKEDVTLLLKNITGMVQPQPAQERERLIQSGTHYCEMLPLEYVPSETYMRVYQEALNNYAKPTAQAIGKLASQLMCTKGKSMVLVSLARAGIPIGILLKRYLWQKYKVQVMHYSISIIRGRGIDRNAMQYLLNLYQPEQLVFVDGWIGKGAILKELKKELAAYPGVSQEIAVVADPANVTRFCGTHEDLLIPSSCLNCTVSGLVSRTFLRSDLIKENDFHGAVYYGELKEQDLSYHFIDAIEKEFETEVDWEPYEMEPAQDGTGLEEVKRLAEEYKISDINLIKPGIGETTRVLLRRIPWKILVAEGERKAPSLAHIMRLAEEKNVPVEEHALIHYKACGIIRNLADI